MRIYLNNNREMLNSEAMCAECDFGFGSGNNGTDVDEFMDDDAFFDAEAAAQAAWTATTCECEDCHDDEDELATLDVSLETAFAFWNGGWGYRQRENLKSCTRALAALDAAQDIWNAAQSAAVEAAEESHEEAHKESHLDAFEGMDDPAADLARLRAIEEAAKPVADSVILETK